MLPACDAHAEATFLAVRATHCRCPSPRHPSRPCLLLRCNLDIHAHSPVISLTSWSSETRNGERSISQGPAHESRVALHATCLTLASRATRATEHFVAQPRTSTLNTILVRSRSRPTYGRAGTRPVCDTATSCPGLVARSRVSPPSVLRVYVEVWFVRGNRTAKVQGSIANRVYGKDL